MRPWSGFGAKSRPGRLQDAQGEKGVLHFWEPFWPKCRPRGHFPGALGVAKSVKKRAFGHKVPLLPFKSRLWELFLKNIEFYANSVDVFMQKSLNVDAKIR